MSLAQTVMLEARKRSDNLYKNNIRQSVYGGWDAFRLGNEQKNSIISKELRDQAKSSIGRTLRVPVLDPKSITLGNTRNVTLGHDENTSDFVDVVWTTISYEFSVSPAQHLDNEFDIIEDAAYKFRSFDEAATRQLDVLALNQLNLAKTQVFAETLDAAKYSVASNVLVSTKEAGDDLLGDLSVMMGGNDYHAPNYMFIGNAGMESKIRKLGQYGQFNEKDKTQEYMDKTLHWTNRLSNGAGHEATGYIVVPANLGYVIQHEREVLLNTSKTATGHAWGTVKSPTSGITYDLYTYEDVVNDSARLRPDMTRTRVMYFGLAVTVGLMVSYNADPTTYAAPIMKAAIANA